MPRPSTRHDYIYVSRASSRAFYCCILYPFSCTRHVYSERTLRRCQHIISDPPLHSVHRAYIASSRILHSLCLSRLPVSLSVLSASFWLFSHIRCCLRCCVTTQNSPLPAKPYCDSPLTAKPHAVITIQSFIHLPLRSVAASITYTLHSR